MSPLNLHLLGPPRIECDGAPIQVDTRKAIALLVYVAITRERHRRDALLNLLWPEYDLDHGRAALRRTLSTLRSVLPGGWLQISRQDVGLNRNADIWLDVDQFHGYLAECGAHGHPASEVCSACLAALEAGVTLYRGDFLSGFGLKDSFNFDDWQFYQSEALRGELSAALEKLVRGLSASGELEAAIGYARRWLELDRLNEAAHGQLMLLYAWSGRRFAALRQYQECVRILESDLHVSPEGSLVKMYRAIVAGRAPEPSTGVLAQRAESARLSAVPTPPPPLTIEGEKRFVTMLYARMCRSFAGVETVSPENEASSVQHLLRIMERILPRYGGGRVERRVGTGVLGVLGARQTRESDPELATRAAIEIREEAQTAGLNVVIGLDTGEVYMGGTDPDGHRQSPPPGTVVEQAIRLAGEAEAGQILVGESAYRFIRRAFEFTPLALEVAATGEPVVAYRVERFLPQPRKARGIEGLRAALIGRDWELARLKEAFAQILGGEGQVVALIGEAGVGKSRLVAELRGGCARCQRGPTSAPVARGAVPRAGHPDELRAVRGCAAGVPGLVPRTRGAQAPGKHRLCPPADGGTR
jgi:DNA-binding SARP family transcriptional activator